MYPAAPWLKGPGKILTYKEEWLEEANRLFYLKRYEGAPLAFSQALRLNPNDAYAYNNEGRALNLIKLPGF